MTLRVFVIRGFGTKKDSCGMAVNFDEVHAKLIGPAITACGYSGGTTAEHLEPGSIHADMFAMILDADIVICDITVHNANVFYELGVRHALRKKHTVLIKGDPSGDTTPFDLMGDRYLKYSVADPASAVPDLVKSMQAGVKVNRETDSPIFLMLPSLAEANAGDVSIVPLEFIEDVERAAKASDKAWLRLLAEDVAGLSFQWDALKVVGRAQWSLRDYAGARETWETVRKQKPKDLETHLALANIYERLYRETLRPVLLEMSNQSIRSVLDIQAITPEQQAEALALHGRNLKTQWRLEFQDLSDQEERREAALERRLLDSYKAYRQAFAADLNAFYPGVAALQMGFILLSLSGGPGWRDLFDGDKVEATRFRDDLPGALDALGHVVRASVDRALARIAKREDKSSRIWANITRADLRFMTVPDNELEDETAAIASAYKSAIEGDRFALDSARAQLSLFASLGVRGAVADEAIRALNKFEDKLKRDEQERPDDPQDKAAKKPLHLVVFSGHTVDGPTSRAPRFPAGAELRARALIEARLRALDTGSERLVVLASAAPGADILAHEACDALGMTSILCLPLPPEVVVQEAFKDYDNWRGRFFAIERARRAGLRQLAENAAPPPWVGTRPVDVWERGNRWVMKMAQAWGAQRITLLALWDGDECPDVTGGTAHMVRLARSTGSFEIDVIDSKALLVT